MINIFYRLILLVFLIISSLSFYGQAYCTEILCSGMLSDGRTDNSKILNDCITIALNEPERTVRIPAGGIYRISPTSPGFTVPEGVTITGTYFGDPKIHSNNQTTILGMFRLSSGSKILNLNFNDNARSVIMGDETAPRGQGFIKEAEIRNNNFGFGSWATLIAYRANNSIIDNNRFIGRIGNTGQNIQIIGGKRNLISNNYTYGAKTAILHKYSRNANGGGYESLIEYNIIRDNTVENFSEEGISFDVVGDDPAQVATLEYDTVAYVTGNQITLAHPGWSQGDNPSYVGYDLVFLSGNMGGRTRRILEQSSATFRLAEPLVSGVNTGDKIVIGATFKRNHIVGNTIISSNRGSILLYGMSFQNVIEKNTLTNGSIQVRHLDAINKPNNSVTGNYGRAPCGYNLIRDNIVGSPEIALNDRMSIDLFYRVPNVSGITNPYNPYSAYGNTVVNNQIRRRLSADQQAVFCIFRNTWGESPNYSNVNFAPCTNIDWDSSWDWLKDAQQNPNFPSLESPNKLIIVN